MRNMRLGYAAPILGRTITFLSVVICWVFFRAETIDGAINILRGMVGMNGLVLDTKSAEYIPSFFGLINFSGKNIGSFGSTVGFIWLALLLVIVWFLPNTQKFVERRNIVIEESISSGLSWKPGYLWGVCLGIIGIYSILNLHNVSEFLYFNF